MKRKQKPAASGWNGSKKRKSIYEDSSFENRQKKSNVKNQEWCAAAFRPKLKFETEKKAETHLKWVKTDYQNKRKPVRAYRCASCNAWHVTSQGKSKKAMKNSQLAKESEALKNYGFPEEGLFDDKFDSSFAVQDEEVKAG